MSHPATRARPALRPELGEAREQGLHNIGEAAALSGVSAKMIRHYELIGVIPAAARTFAGYRLYNPSHLESLQFIRQRLRTPTEARGCHVGEYLGYFVEGHVHPTALDELSRRRPAALGLMTEVPARSEARHVDIASDAGSRVLLVAPNSKSSVWFQAHATTEAGGTKEEEGT